MLFDRSLIRLTVTAGVQKVTRGQTHTDAAGQLTGWAVGGARGDAEHEQGEQEAGPTGRDAWLCANGFGNLGPMWGGSSGLQQGSV